MVDDVKVSRILLSGGQFFKLIRDVAPSIDDNDKGRCLRLVFKAPQMLVKLEDNSMELGAVRIGSGKRRLSCH